MDQNPNQPQVTSGTGLNNTNGVMSQPPVSASSGMASNPAPGSQATAASPTSYISGMNEPVTAVPKPAGSISSMPGSSSGPTPSVSPQTPPVDNNNPFPPPASTGVPLASHPHHGSKAPLYMAIIVIFIATVVALGWIIYSSTQSQSAIMPAVTPSPVAEVTIPAPSVTMEVTEDDVEKTSEQSDSDEVIDIEKDVTATDVSTIETDLNSIQTETSQ